MFQYGDTTTIHAFIYQRLWLMQSVSVIKDTPQETVLLLAPGAECAYPSGYWRWKRGNTLEGTRWDDVKSMSWTLRQFEWHTNRVLIHMMPGQYYATYLMWEDATDQFKCYYINFQTPFQRSQYGFETLDLELDIVINPDFTWSYKDEDNYLLGLREGCVTQREGNEIDKIKSDIAHRINARQYPLDQTWIDWRPDPEWRSSRLPEGWNRT